MKSMYAFVASPNHVYPDHPERPARFDVLESRLGTLDAELVKTESATREEIAYVHTPGLVSALENICRDQAPGIIDYAPTYVTPTSFEDALRAAGGVLSCTRSVLRGDASHAFAIVRPPGHHAEPDRAMGFCLFNNVAIAARDALQRGMERVAIIDYDAHHGNGTQAAFLNDQRVAFLSTHQWGIYPGTGWFEEAPHARKRIVNIPLPARAGDSVYAQIGDRLFIPFVEAFKPQMLLVSVGFDAHWSDPLTMLGLSSAGYYLLARQVIALAQEYCEGKIVFVLEGGYDPVNLANGVEAVFAAAAGKGELATRDPNPNDEPDCTSRIEEIRRWHGF
jgi:acetoin utilization deacetylase AcuC-like enzyme